MSTPSIQEAWQLFKSERSIALCPTSLTADYTQVTRWLAQCPIRDLAEGRAALTWILQQEPVKSARRVAMYLRSLYRWAAAEDVALLPRNPVANFRMPKAPQSDGETVVIPRDETAILFTALQARQRKSPWAQYAEFMLQTAMRTGEVRALRWNDISERGADVHSNFTLTHGHKNSTKTNKRRHVPLNSQALAILEELPRCDDYIFPISRNAFMSFFRDRSSELLAAGLISHRYRPYDLRHTAISRWLEAGIPVAQAARWAGNTSEMIWKHYCNVTTDYAMPEL